MNDDDYNEESFNSAPENALDMNMRLIDPLWGKKEIPQKLKDELSKFSFMRDDKGNFLKDEQNRLMVSNEGSLWELLGFYTRDMRLSNLDEKNFAKCKHSIDLANDLLKMKYYNAFLISLSRAVTILELRQSHKGFLRRRQGTRSFEKFSKEERTPDRKGLMSSFKK